MNITIMSRKDAIQYCSHEHDNKTIIISISDPAMLYRTKPSKSKTNGVIDVLRLSFADADRAGMDIYGREVDETDLMTDDDARKVVEFLNRYPNVDVIVHCDAGISRSSGVAAAISKYYTGSDKEIFNSFHYYPNMWCYRKTLEALMTQNGSDDQCCVAE